jgi:hypothetical protein
VFVDFRIVFWTRIVRCYSYVMAYFMLCYNMLYYGLYYVMLCNVLIIAVKMKVRETFALLPCFYFNSKEMNLIKVSILLITVQHWAWR